MLELQEMAQGEQSYNLATKLNWLKNFPARFNRKKTVSVCFTIGVHALCSSVTVAVKGETTEEVFFMQS